VSELPSHNLLTVKETAAYLRLPLPTVYYLVQRGEIPATQIGGRWRIQKWSLDRYILRQTSTQTKIPIGPAANTPGEILRTEFLEPLGLSQNELAKQSGLARMRISEIVRGRRKMTAKTAIALGKALDIEPQFWLNLQRDYDLAVEAKKSRGLSVRVRSVARAVSATLTPTGKAGRLTHPFTAWGMGRFARVDDEPDEPEHGDPVVAYKNEILKRIDEAIARLSPEHRVVIEMKEKEGLQYHEIAKILNCSVGTVIRRLHYAYIKLKTFLREEVGRTAAQPGYQTAEGVTSVKETIADLVRNEDARNPLSDKEIVEILSDRGMPIAQRTVAKYRGELNILPSNLRKEF
jgi:addiction module HigA family antidote